MPSQTKPKSSRHRDEAASSASTNDPRFASITTDPRFRLPSARHARVGVDQRFSRMFKDDDFNRKASVDRYGRKVKQGDAKKELQRFYKMDDEDDKASAKRRPQEVVGSDDDSGDEDDEDEEEEGADGDSEVEAELRRIEGGKDFAREGFSESETDEDSSDEDDDVEAVDLPDEEQADAVPMGDVSSRFAVVNLDWDNIRATDLMAVAQSFAPTGGNVSQVVVYPSEYGKERLEREELEGPPRDIFSSTQRQDDGKDDDEDSDEEDQRIKKSLQQEDKGEEFDSAKLRQYQLDRLRYYYAVVTCDSEQTAKALYDAMDGREYLTTANFFDLRFIPDEVSFDADTPRDECSKLSAGYRPNEFVTDALTHSKVRLTWDADDTTRKEAQKRAFSRAEIDENDLKAYIGTDSSDNEDDAEGDDKAEAQRQKMRAALGLATQPVKSSKAKESAPVGDMQITFSSGLSGAAKDEGVFENDPTIANETTRERYIRKEKERKARRKEKAKAVREGVDPDAAEEADEEAVVVEAPTEEAGDLGFDDPFFNDAPAAQKAEKDARKANKKKKREEREAQEKAAAAQRAELELLMVDDKEGDMRHFNMNEIQKAEKAAKRKNKKGSKKSAGIDVASAPDGQEFVMETQDPRFSKLFESHEYAIDPSNPKYKGTLGMKALLEEGRKKRKGRSDEEAQDLLVERKGKRSRTAEAAPAEDGDDLQKLLARVKAKTKNRS